MARYTGPREKLERRIGEKLFLKGERSHSPKSAITKRPYPPGVHGKGRAKMSEFGSQLKSKQKVRHMYRLMEKQFKRTVKDTLRAGGGQTGIIEALETRLDNVVFRAGFAQSRDQARQLVNHGHILLNGRKTSTPSVHVKTGDVISVREGSQRMPYFASLMTAWLKGYEAPAWVSLEKEKMSAKVTGKPDTQASGVKLEDVQAIVEYYSR